jgi:hypothetical protein
MSVPEMHEMTAEIGLGLEPPLSPPVVGGPGTHIESSGGFGLTELPSPPPAIRPPEAARPEPVAATPPAAALLSPVETTPPQPANDLPSLAPPEEELPTMAPQDAPIELERVRPVEIKTEDLPLVAPPEPRPAASVDSASATGVRLVVRLGDGDRVEVGEFVDFGAAMEGAQEVIEQLTAATATSWPFYAGRFIRPDAIVSVDLVEAGRR